MKKRILFFTISCLSISARMPEIKQQEDAGPLPSFRRKLKIEKIEQKQEEKQRKKLQGKTKRKGLHNISYRKMYSEMNFEELNAKKIQLIEQEKWDAAIQVLQGAVGRPGLIALCDDINTRADLIIELADLQYTQGFYDDAGKRYKEFIHLYPGNKKTEYAHYRSIVCTSERILSSDRDQSKTEETLELANQFLERTIFTQYRDEVEVIRAECFQTLAHSELNIGEFYIKMGDFQAAQRRLHDARTEWLPKAPEINLRLAQLESNLAVQFEDFKLPETELLVVDAVKEAAPKKKNMALRF